MWVIELGLEFWRVLRESGAYMLLGFVLAGLLHVVMARGRWTGWLRGLKARSVLLATAVGLPLPLCSCSVLPAAVSLRRQGAGKGAVLAFLISTPETSVQSVMLTYSLLGPLMAAARVVAAFCTSVLAGLTENLVERRWPTASATDSKTPSAVAPGDSAPDGGAPNSAAAACCACGADSAGPAPSATVSPAPASRPTWRAGMRFAFVDIFDDVVGWMLLGVIVAAVIEVTVPGFIIQAVFGPPWQAMLVMLVIGVPLYVCAESSTPIAAALIAQGVNPGAALVFLLAGPATNIGAIGVLLRELGRRTVIIYLICIAVASLLMGQGLNWLLASQGIDLRHRALCEPLLPEWFKTVGALAFLTWTLASMRRRHWLERLATGLSRMLGLRITRRRMLVAGGAVALGGWATGGWCAVTPGQLGLVKQFGRLTGETVGPGWYWTWPKPVGAVDLVEARGVERLVLGYKFDAQGRPTEAEEVGESWILLGDENIGNVKSVTHWHMRPGQERQFAYAAVDRPALVRGALRSALRSVLGGAEIDTVLTTGRPAVVQQIRDRAQETLDRCAAGIEIGYFELLDLHAPPPVHDAFRDVASALEDRATRRNEAQTYAARILPQARGNAAGLTLDAEGYRLRTGAQAVGQAGSFRDLYAAFQDYPDLTRLRLFFESCDRVLPGRRKCVKPAAGNFELDLRFDEANQAGGPAF